MILLIAIMIISVLKGRIRYGIFFFYSKIIFIRINWTLLLIKIGNTSKLTGRILILHKNFNFPLRSKRSSKLPKITIEKSPTQNGQLSLINGLLILGRIKPRIKNGKKTASPPTLGIAPVCDDLELKMSIKPKRCPCFRRILKSKNTKEAYIRINMKYTRLIQNSFQVP
mgnify:CR=1 FL=1